MSFPTYLAQSGQAFRRILRLMARPVRIDREREGIVIHPFRGYGSREEVFLMGQVLKQGQGASERRKGGLVGDLLDAGRRMLRKGVSGGNLTAVFAGTKQSVTTDRNGYFRVHLQLDKPKESFSNHLWHSMDLELHRPVRVTTRGTFFIPPPGARFVVISDIDDTVMYTGVSNKLKMLWRLFAEQADSRVAFPGVAAFYRALHYGNDRTELNPMLYVSRGPWNLYEVLEEFFSIHDIPVGPILFLRDWGISLTHPFPRKAKGHKLSLIRRMLALYEDLPFVLIGDSGQKDPEIYAQVVRENPGRIKAVYIRNIDNDPDREQAIQALAEEAVDAGSTLLLAVDSFAMAEDAARKGLITPTDLDEVLRERIVQEDEVEPGPVRKVKKGKTGPGNGEDLHDALNRERANDSGTSLKVEGKETGENVQSRK